MAQYSSNRQRKVNIGISSYTENQLVLDVIGDANIVGIVTASAFVGDFIGTVSNSLYADAAGIATFAVSSGIASYADVSGISTVAEGLTGTPDIIVGIATATTFVGNLIGTATNAGIASYADVSGISTFAVNAGISSYADISGISTVAEGLTGTPDIIVGIATATTFVGNLVGIASTAIKLQNVRTFEITGDVLAAPQDFDGTQNVSFAASIAPNSVGLGTYTYGDYVKNITGTIGEIEVSITSGEGVSPQIGLPDDVTIATNLTVGNDVQINRNLNVNGNITVGGTTAFLTVENLIIKDRDIITGFVTDSFGNDASTDVTANSGGIAVASTEGTPLVDLNIVGIETLPSTYKKIMWFKENAFAGLNTDAWLFNYGVGIGSTQIPSGVRLAVGGVQFTDNDLIEIRNINASGVITATTFVGDLIGTATNADIASYAEVSGISTFSVSSGIASYADVSGISTVAEGLTGTPDIIVGIATATTFVGNLVGIASTSIDVIGGIGSLTSLIVSGVSTLGFITGTDAFFTGIVTATKFVGEVEGVNVSGSVASATTATNVIGGIGSITTLNVSGVSTLGTVEISSGIITASSGIVTYYGDGSKLEGVESLKVVIQDVVSTPVYPTFADNIGVSSIGISTDQLVFVPSSGNLGIGTTDPTSKLTVDGDVLVSGVVTASAFSGPVELATTATNVIGGIGSLSTLSVSGISSFQNVSIAKSIFDSTGSLGVNQYVLSATPDGVLWQSITGVGGISGINITSSTDDAPFNIPFINIGSGTTAVAYVSPSSLTFNPSNNFIGIGTNTPVARLDVRGTGNFIGTSYDYYIPGPGLYPYFSLQPEFYEGTDIISIQQPKQYDLGSLEQVLRLTGIGTTAGSRFDYFGDLYLNGRSYFYTNLTVPTINLNTTPSSNTNPVYLNGSNYFNQSGAALYTAGNGLLGLSTNFSRYGNLLVNRSGIGTGTDLADDAIFSPLMRVSESDIYNFFLDAPQARVNTQRILVSTATTFTPLVIDNDYTTSYFTINSSAVGIGSTTDLTTGVTFNPVFNISANGNVGIGTSSSSARLEISGPTRITSVGSTADEQIDIRHYRNIAVPGISTNNVGAISFDGSAGISTEGRTYSSPLFTITQSSTDNLFSIASYNFKQFTANNIRIPTFDVTQAGNVGIGSAIPRTGFDVLFNSYFNAPVVFQQYTQIQDKLIFSENLQPGLTSTTSIKVEGLTPGISTYAPTRGAVVFDGIIDTNITANNGGQLVTVVNDNSDLFVVNRFVGLSSLSYAPAGQKNIETVFCVKPDGNIGIATTNPQTRIEINGKTRINSSGSTVLQNIDITHFKPSASGVGTFYPTRGSLLFDGIFDPSTNFNGGQLITVLNDNSDLFTVNRFVGLNTLSPPPTGTRFIENVLNITSLGNIGIGTSRPLQRIQVGTTNASGVSTDTNVLVVTTTGSVGLGTTNPRQKLDVVGDVNISGVTTVGLGSTSSPSVNSTMSFELTDNTTLTVRVRGTDGVVRTGIVSLS